MNNLEIVTSSPESTTLVLDELVVCEVVSGSFCEWRNVKNAAADSGTRMVLCGGNVKQI